MDKEDRQKLLCFDALLDATEDMIFFKDTNLHYIACSPAFAAMVGLPDRHAVRGVTDFELFDHALATRYTQDDRAMLEDGAPILSYVEPLPDEDGRQRYSSTSKHIVRAADGSIVGMLGIARDITLQMELAEEKERRELSRQMFDDVIEADVTENTLLRPGRSRCLKELGLEKHASFEQAMHAIAYTLVHPDYQKEFLCLYTRTLLQARFLAGKTEFDHIALLRYPRQDYQWMEATTRLYQSKVSDTVRMAVFLRNADEETRDKEQLRNRAERDALTGLLNRESAFAQMEQRLSQQCGGRQCALLFLDLDRFKEVNDTQGHLAGDAVLRRVAEDLRALAGEDGLVGRVGGDEFLALLCGVQSCAQLAARVQAFLDAPQQTEHSPLLTVTSSVGIALSSGEQEFQQLYAQADSAMYTAKRSGRNRLSFYGED